MLDTFYYGDTSRISPEAPIPVLRIEKEVKTLGGAGNVVNNLHSLSIPCTLAGIIGTDADGQKVLSLLKEKNIGTETLIASPEAQTIAKNRYIAQDQQLLRADFERTTGYDSSIINELLSSVSQHLKHADVLILSDYGKGALPVHIIKALLEEAHKQGKVSIVDPKGTDYSPYAKTTFVTPNRKELREATNLPTDSDEEVVAAARKLIKDHHIQNVLATRSEKGMTLVKGSGDVHHFKTIAKEVYDVSGAGDTVVATLASALSVGDTMEEAVQLANLAGTVVVGKVGTATVTLQELEEALIDQDRHESAHKVYTLKDAKAKVDDWKNRGLKVGFTNGCFDLLHPGHLKILKESKEACDRLVVAVNSDASVKRLKGDARPLQSEDARAAVLEALACVDLVVIFGEDTPIIPIETLLPDVLIKGADYKVSEVVGADVVQKNGGTVHLVDLAQGHSTTSTVEKMNKL